MKCRACLCQNCVARVVAPARRSAARAARRAIARVPGRFDPVKNVTCIARPRFPGPGASGAHACSATATSKASTLPPTAPVMATWKLVSPVRVVVMIACSLSQGVRSQPPL
jgi:hypothetical protein